MELVLSSNQPTGEPFTSAIPFIVFLDTYTDGWFLEYAFTKADANQMNWKKWHSQPLQQHGELSRLLVYGVEGMSFRLNSGTVGATAFQVPVNIKVFR